MKDYSGSVVFLCVHYDDVIMGAIASLITSLTIVYSTVYSDADQWKHQSSASLAFAEMANNAENVVIWWRHHDYRLWPSVTVITDLSHRGMFCTRTSTFSGSQWYEGHRCLWWTHLTCPRYVLWRPLNDLNLPPCRKMYVFPAEWGMRWMRWWRCLWERRISSVSWMQHSFSSAHRLIGARLFKWPRSFKCWRLNLVSSADITSDHWW